MRCCAGEAKVAVPGGSDRLSRASKTDLLDEEDEREKGNNGDAAVVQGTLAPAHSRPSHDRVRAGSSAWAAPALHSSESVAVTVHAAAPTEPCRRNPDTVAGARATPHGFVALGVPSARGTARQKVKNRSCLTRCGGATGGKEGGGFGERRTPPVFESGRAAFAFSKK